ncbi:MAG: cysteinyl-tRNA synthetase, partial [archaeon GW2011_AR21]
LKELDSILPIFKFGFVQEIPEEVQRLAEERENARKAQDWKKADEIRAKILEKGYRVDDTPEGTRVKKLES